METARWLAGRGSARAGRQRPARDGAGLDFCEQFEEAFTLGVENDRRRTRRDDFLAQIEELIENRPPQTLRERWNKDPDPGKQPQSRDLITGRKVSWASFHPDPQKLLLVTAAGAADEAEQAPGAKGQKGEVAVWNVETVMFSADEGRILTGRGTTGRRSGSWR